MVKIAAPKLAYRLERAEDAGSDTGFHLKVMEGEDMILMSCGAMGKKDEAVQAPIALITAEDACPTCFAPLFSAGTRNSPQGIGMEVVVPERAVKLEDVEEEENGLSYHVSTVSAEEGIVTACGLMGSESGADYALLSELEGSQLCPSCFGAFKVEGLAPHAASMAAALSQEGEVIEEFPEFPSIDELISNLGVPEAGEEKPAAGVSEAAAKAEPAAFFEEEIEPDFEAAPAPSPEPEPLQAHGESLAESLGFGSIDDLLDQITENPSAEVALAKTVSEEVPTGTMPARAAETAPPQTAPAVPKAEEFAGAKPPEPVKPTEKPDFSKVFEASPPVKPAAPRPAPPPPKPPESSGSRIFAAALVLAVIAGGVAWYLTSSGPARSPAVAVSEPKKSAGADTVEPGAEERKAMAESKAREEAEKKAVEERARAEALKSEAEDAEKLAREKALEADRAQKAETAKSRNNAAEAAAAQKARAKAEEEARLVAERSARAKAEAEAAARAAAEAEAARARREAEEKARAQEEARAAGERAKAEAAAIAKEKPAFRPEAAPYSMHFNDKNLEKCVREAANIPAGAKLTDDLFKGLRTLECQGRGITSVAGVESLLSLERVNLANNEIVDMTPLAFLPDLTYLNLKFNKITDISAITRIPSKCEINLLDNPIKDIQPLLKRRKK